MNGPAAIDRQHRARDEARLIGRQIQRRVRDIVGLAEVPRQRLQLGEPAADVWTLLRAPAHRRGDQARTNHVGPNSGAVYLSRETRECIPKP